MPELDPFDIRLESAVHAFADAAHTRVDAAATAERAIRRGRAGRLSWLGYAVPVPVSILIVLALVLLALALSLGIGSPSNQHGLVPPVAMASPLPSPAATPGRSARPIPIASPDGEGDEAVAGTETLTLTRPYVETGAGDITRLRDGAITTAASTDDPRAGGTGAWQASADLRAGVGPAWGSYRLENAGGAWEGTCTGSLRADGAGGIRNCWLTGSGDYDGYTYFFTATWSDMGGDIRGVIVPSSPPAP